jgi:hypothetical protein
MHMIKDRETARQVIHALDEASSIVNESIRLVKEQCSDDEFATYRQAAGFVMGYLYTDVLAAIYKQHRDLEPPELQPPLGDDPTSAG